MTTAIELFIRDDQFWREALLPHSDAPVEALQYTGTPASAESIAAAFDVEVVISVERVAVFAVPDGWVIAVDDYDRDNRAFGIVRRGWVWRDVAAHTIGAEWDEYLREHFTPVHPADTVAGGVGAR